MASHQWGTVSKSYRHDLLEGSPLKAILRRCPMPFAHSNGLRVNARMAQLAKAAKNHDEAKLMVQSKYAFVACVGVSLQPFRCLQSCARCFAQ